MPLALKNLIPDVEEGLAKQAHRLNDAAMAQAFYDYQGKRFMQVFLNDAETPFDYVARPYRAGGFLRQVTGVLTEHLYSPGPAREHDVPAAQDFLDQVYKDNHVNALMMRGDQLSTINDVAAIQVDADLGDPRHPIKLRMWGAQDFHAWTEPGDRTTAAACVTVDRYDDRDTYRLWNDEEVCEITSYKTELIQGIKSGTVTSPPTPHGYGCLPFSFVHYEQPITTFWEVGIGTFLTQAEVRGNDRLSRLDQSINKHLNPVPVAKNVDPTWQPILEPQRFLRLNRKGVLSGQGGYEKDDPPDLSYLEPRIDVAGAWEDLLKYINQVLEACRVPLSAVRMEQTGVASGISLIVEQAPLLTRARARRGAWTIYECCLAETILRCAGNYYGKRPLVAAADNGTLTLSWPQPTVPVPTTDMFELMIAQVNAGIMSLPRLVQQWFGMDREASFRYLESIEEDNLELAKRAPKLHLALAGPAAVVGVTPEGSANGQAQDGEGDFGPRDRSEDQTINAADTDNQNANMHQMIINL